MSLFDKLKKEAAGAITKAGGSAVNQAIGAASGAIRNAGNRSFTVTFTDIPTSLDALMCLPEAALTEPH